MKDEKEEAKEYFERNNVLVFALLAVALFLDWLSGYLLINTNPWGTLVGVPGLILTLQSLWLLVNPYAIVYEDRFEIKQSLIYNREFYFLDMKDVTNQKKNSLTMIYNDDDAEPLPTLGIKSTDKILFYQKLKEKISISTSTRIF